jgi:hypothetical protein
MKRKRRRQPQIRYKDPAVEPLGSPRPLPVGTVTIGKETRQLRRARERCGLPTPAEQQAEYERQKAIYDRLLAKWEADGRVPGRSPARPVRPHTPGWVP